MSIRLRYLAHDLEVPVGQFVIGRSPECQLSLDDALVSRRHALLTVSERAVSIEDLGSRNGVLVNGIPISGVQTLADGDLITIGTQELTIARIDRPGLDMDLRHTDTRMKLPTLAAQFHHGTPAALGSPSPSSPALPEINLPEPGHPEMAEPTLIGEPLDTFNIVTDARAKKPDTLSLLGLLADKAFAMGKPEEAERLLQRALRDLLIQVQVPNHAIELATLERSVKYATRLVTSLGHETWLNYIFELFTKAQLLLPAATVDELYDVMRKARVDKPLFRSYLEMLRAKTNTFGPNEKFVLQRIEGLEKVSSLR